MSGRGRDSANMDAKDLDLKNYRTGRRLVAQRMRAWSRTRLHLSERPPRDQAYSYSSTLTGLEPHNWNNREIQPSQRKSGHNATYCDQAHSSLTFQNSLLSRVASSIDRETRKDRVRPPTRSILTPGNQRDSRRTGTE